MKQTTVLTISDVTEAARMHLELTLGMQPITVTSVKPERTRASGFTGLAVDWIIRDPNVSDAFKQSLEPEVAYELNASSVSENTLA